MEPDHGDHATEHHSHGAHEKSDAGVRSAGILGGAFVILLVFGLVTGYLSFRFFNSPATVGPPASPISSARIVPKGPRLQINGHEDLLDYLNRQEHALSSYGWVDQKAGVVRVPIDQAMDMVLKSGLPVRSSESNGKTATGGQNPGSSPARKVGNPAGAPDVQ